MTLTIITNIPALIVDIFNGTKLSTNYQMPATAFSSIDGREEIVKCEIELEKGIYNIRLSINYCKDGGIFILPLFIERGVEIEDDIEVNFMARLE